MSKRFGTQWNASLPWILAFVLSLWTVSAQAQRGGPGSIFMLADEYQKSGAYMLKAFQPVAEAVRDSVALLQLEGKTVALATVVDGNGLLLTKASEIKEGKLTCLFANGREVPARVLATDQNNDVALIQAEGTKPKPVSWAEAELNVGQWVVTPGTREVPEAAGNVSVVTRRIIHKRALLGVLLDTNTGPARVLDTMRGFGAARAGITSGDVILTVNEVEIKDREHLVTTVREFKEGQTIKVKIRRDEEELELEVQLTAEDGGAARRGSSAGRRGASRISGPVSTRLDDFQLAIQHDTVLQPWQCGGPLVNLDGEAVGLNIARAGRVASYALPVSLVKRILEDLKAQAQKSSVAP